MYFVVYYNHARDDFLAVEMYTLVLMHRFVIEFLTLTYG